MSPNNGAANPMAIVAKRSFLITEISPTEFGRLGNGKLSINYEIIPAEGLKPTGIGDCHWSSSH
jgi:hypothetical protein